MVKFYRKTLKNGMVIVFEKRELPVVSVAFAVRAGGMNETWEEKGISHFIEHMLYKGTPSRDSKKIADEIEKNGGIMNGFTGEEVTAFWCKMPSRHLNVALEVLGDMVKNPLFDSGEIEKERKVIYEEMKMRKDNPVVRSMDRIVGLLYDEPFGLSIIGSEETLGKMTRETLVKKFRQLYAPKNMILCVVGDAEIDSLVKFAEKNFPSSPGGGIPHLKISKKNGREAEEREGIDQANLVFAYHVPASDDNKSYAAEVLNTLMAEGMSSRLFREIREKRNLAYSISGGSEINKDYAYNSIFAGTSRENVEKVKSLVIGEFRKVSKSLEDRELRQVKEQLIGNYQISMEDSQGQMADLLSYELCKDVKDYYRYEDFISKVRISDVKSMAKSAAEDYSFFSLVPKAKKIYKPGSIS